MIATGIGLHNAGIDGEALALGQSRRHRCPHHALEDVTEDVALAKTAKAVLGERRVVWNLVLQIELAAVRQVQLDFVTELAF